MVLEVLAALVIVLSAVVGAIEMQSLRERREEKLLLAEKRKAAIAAESYLASRYVSRAEKQHCLLPKPAETKPTVSSPQPLLPLRLSEMTAGQIRALVYKTDTCSPAPREWIDTIHVSLVPYKWEYDVGHVLNGVQAAYLTAPGCLKQPLEVQCDTLISRLDDIAGVPNTLRYMPGRSNVQLFPTPAFECTLELYVGG